MSTLKNRNREDNMIRFENVTKKYDNDSVAVDHLNLNIEDGEFFRFYWSKWMWQDDHLKNDQSAYPAYNRDNLYQRKTH